MRNADPRTADFLISEGPFLIILQQERFQLFFVISGSLLRHFGVASGLRLGHFRFASAPFLGRFWVACGAMSMSLLGPLVFYTTFITTTFMFSIMIGLCFDPGLIPLDHCRVGSGSILDDSEGML